MLIQKHIMFTQVYRRYSLLSLALLSLLYSSWTFGHWGGRGGLRITFDITCSLQRCPTLSPSPLLSASFLSTFTSFHLAIGTKSCLHSLLPPIRIGSPEFLHGCRRLFFQSPMFLGLPCYVVYWREVEG